jgi:hypothetical protein
MILQLALPLSTLAACATTHTLEPVGKNRLRMNASLGGPVLNLGGAPIPLPIATVNAAYGVEDDVDVHVGLHPVALAFNPGEGSVPLLGMNGGVTWHPLQRFRNALAIGGELYGFANRRDAVVFGNAWIGGAGRPTRWLLLGGGIHNLLRVGVTSPEFDTRTFWTPTVFLLARFNPTERIGIDIEPRWYAFSQNTAILTPNWVSLGGIGAVGVTVGFSYTFGERTE